MSTAAFSQRPDHVITEERNGVSF